MGGQQRNALLAGLLILTGAMAGLVDDAGRAITRYGSAAGRPLVWPLREIRLYFTDDVSRLLDQYSQQWLVPPAYLDRHVAPLLRQSTLGLALVSTEIEQSVQAIRQAGGTALRDVAEAFERKVGMADEVTEEVLKGTICDVTDTLLEDGPSLETLEGIDFGEVVMKQLAAAAGHLVFADLQTVQEFADGLRTILFEEVELPEDRIGLVVAKPDAVMRVRLQLLARCLGL